MQKVEGKRIKFINEMKTHTTTGRWVDVQVNETELSSCCQELLV